MGTILVVHDELNSLELPVFKKDDRSKPELRYFPFYVLADGTHLNYPEGFYPINTLRDLAIESISTTHLLVADMDVFPSMGLESSISEYAEVLRDHHNMIALTLFRYKNHSSLSQCYSEGVCEELYVMKYYAKD